MSLMVNELSRQLRRGPCITGLTCVVYFRICKLLPTLTLFLFATPHKGNLFQEVRSGCWDACRLEVEKKSQELAETAASKASLEQELSVLQETHSALIQQHAQVQEQLTTVQASLSASEEGRASVEVRRALRTNLRSWRAGTRGQCVCIHAGLYNTAYRSNSIKLLAA